MKQGRRLEGHGDMGMEDMKKMMETMLGECEKKCPGVIDGAVDVTMATAKEKDPTKMMMAMVNAACPVVDIMKCADENKDVCSMGDDDGEGGIKELIPMCDCLTDCPDAMDEIMKLGTVFDSDDETKIEAALKTECADSKIRDSLTCAKGSTACVNAMKVKRLRRLEAHEKKEEEEKEGEDLAKLREERAAKEGESSGDCPEGGQRGGDEGQKA